MTNGYRPTIVASVFDQTTFHPSCTHNAGQTYGIISPPFPVRLNNVSNSHNGVVTTKPAICVVLVDSIRYCEVVDCVENKTWDAARCLILGNGKVPVGEHKGSIQGRWESPF